MRVTQSYVGPLRFDEVVSFWPLVSYKGPSFCSVSHTVGLFQCIPIQRVGQGQVLVQPK